MHEKEMSSFEFLSIGQITLDVIRDADGEHGPFAGGGALYAAVVSAQLGADTAVLGRVGEDFPERAISELNGLGVDTTGIQRGAGRTARLTIDYSGAGEETVDIDAGVGYDLSLVAIQDQHASVRVIHVSTVKPPFAQDVLEWAAHTRGARVSFAPKSDLKHERPDVVDALFGCTKALFLNEFELSLYAKGSTILERATHLLARGPEVVVVTQRERGSLIITEDEVLQIDAYRPAVIHSLCGPRDAYVAAFWFALLRGYELPEVGRFASMIATCVMSHHGLPLDRSPFERMLRDPFCEAVAITHRARA